MNIDIDLLPRQKVAFWYLTDNATTQILFGGGAGGGKSRLLCMHEIASNLKYPGTRGLIGRAKLSALKQTTLNTYFEVLAAWSLKPGKHYKYNATDHVCKFYNGSETIFKDLFLYPSDPEFTSLGSFEITRAGIDEAPDVTRKAVSIVESRIRYKIKEYSLTAKLLLTCNPHKGWLYNEFYKPAKEGTLPPYRKFVQALSEDNNYLPGSYKQQLERLDEISRERLLYGNWEYDNAADRMFQYDKLNDMFTNEYVEPGQRYITADIARLGSDKAVIGRWSGWRLEEITSFEKSRLTVLQDEINRLCRVYQIPLSNVICDEDGVGGGVVDNLRCQGFVNNSVPLNDSEVNGEKPNYANLKTQCSYRLAERVNRGGVYIVPTMDRDTIIQEFEAVRRKDVDKDGKLAIVPKEKMKEILGRSPDYYDMVMMREWFDLPQPRIIHYGFAN